MTFEEWVELAGRGLEGAGVGVITLGALLATGRFLGHVRDRSPDAYQDYRRGLGRAILLGLELLVAGDIIRSVAVEPSFTSVGVLAIIVAIRTFLSMSLETEINGRLPWQQSR